MTNIRNRQAKSLLVYMVMHFAIDFSCFYYLFGTFSKYDYIGLTSAKGFILYNFLAFGMQVLIGTYYDERNREKAYRTAGLIGTLLVMAGLAVNALLPVFISDKQGINSSRISGIPYAGWLGIVLVILALGNAFFHVAGGADSLIYGNGRMSRCGLFVSTGALGVSIGTYAGANHLLEEYQIIIFLFLGYLAIWRFCDAKIICEYNKPEKKQRPISMLPILCMLAIVVRAYVGAILTVSFDVLFLAAFCTFFGKAIGGFLADRCSGKIAGTVAVFISAICFFFFGQYEFMNVLGIISFNIAMPITLYSLYVYYPDNPGFAFGLSTFALLVGSIGSGLILVSSGKQLLIFILAILAAACIFVSTPKDTKGLQAGRDLE